jgi:competence protein ComEA
LPFWFLFLPGFPIFGQGEKKANAIIEFRKANGLFKQPEDLTNVPGIGPKTLEANKDRIVVE